MSKGFGGLFRFAFLGGRPAFRRTFPVSTTTSGPVDSLGRSCFHASTNERKPGDEQRSAFMLLLVKPANGRRDVGDGDGILSAAMRESWWTDDDNPRNGALHRSMIVCFLLPIGVVIAMLSLRRRVVAIAAIPSIMPRSFCKKDVVRPPADDRGVEVLNGWTFDSMKGRGRGDKPPLFSSIQ
jgi:hypothetical protein